MSQLPQDDLPRPYGPGWWDPWPGETPGPGTTVPAGPPATPPRTVSTLAEYMASVRAAVPYLDAGDGQARPAEPHHEAARSLLGRLARAAGQVVHAAAHPRPASPQARTHGASPAAVSADRPADAPPPAARARTRC